MIIHLDDKYFDPIQNLGKKKFVGNYKILVNQISLSLEKYNQKLKYFIENYSYNTNQKYENAFYKKYINK